MPSVSSDRDDFLDSVFRNATEPLLATVLENQGNRIFEAVKTFSFCPPLAICAWEFWTEGDEPISISLDNCGELVGQILNLPRSLSQIPNDSSISLPLGHQVGAVSQPGKGPASSFQPVACAVFH